MAHWTIFPLTCSQPRFPIGGTSIHWRVASFLLAPSGQRKELKSLTRDSCGSSFNRSRKKSASLINTRAPLSTYSTWERIPLFPWRATRKSFLSFYSRYPIVNSLAAFFRTPIIIIDLLTLTAAKFHLHFRSHGKIPKKNLLCMKILSLHILTKKELNMRIS